MKKLILLLFLGTTAFMSCDIDQTQEGELPSVDVDIDAEEGALPAFDVDWADVDVTTRTETVKVPKVVVVMEEVEVEVPVVDVDMPDAGEKEEMAIAVEAEVRGTMKDLEIEEVYATDNNLYVISTLKDNGTKMGKETARVSDRIVLNAPEDLNVKHYIVGERPEGTFNRQYKYINAKSDLNDRMKNGKMIYKRS